MPHIGYFPIPGYPKPLLVGHNAFDPTDNTYTFSRAIGVLTGHDTNPEEFQADVFLPDGSKIDRLTLWGYRDTAGTVLQMSLYKIQKSNGAETLLATVAATETTGWGSWYTETITDPAVDLDNYWYLLRLTHDAVAAASEVAFTCAQIDWS